MPDDLASCMATLSLFLFMMSANPVACSGTRPSYHAGRPLPAYPEQPEASVLGPNVFYLRTVIRKQLRLVATKAWHAPRDSLGLTRALEMALAPSPNPAQWPPIVLIRCLSCCLGQRAETPGLGSQQRGLGFCQGGGPSSLGWCVYEPSHFGCAVQCCPERREGNLESLFSGGLVTCLYVVFTGHQKASSYRPGHEIHGLAGLKNMCMYVYIYIHKYIHIHIHIYVYITP